MVSILKNNYQYYKKLIGGRNLLFILGILLPLISCRAPEADNAIRISIDSPVTSAKTVSAADGITGYRLTVADDSETILDSGVGMTSDFILTDIMPGTYEVTAYGYASAGIDDAAVARSTEIMTLEKGGEYSIMLDDPIEGKTGEIVIEAIPPYSGVYTHDRDTLSIGYIDGRNEAITLSTADGTLIYEGSGNGVWHYSIAAGIIPSGNAIMTLSVTSDDGNTAERMAMAVLLPELSHTASEGDFDFREGEQELLEIPDPIVLSTAMIPGKGDGIIANRDEYLYIMYSNGLQDAELQFSFYEENGSPVWQDSPIHADSTPTVDNPSVTSSARVRIVSDGKTIAESNTTEATRTMPSGTTVRNKDGLITARSEAEGYSILIWPEHSQFDSLNEGELFLPSYDPDDCFRNVFFNRNERIYSFYVAVVDDSLNVVEDLQAHSLALSGEITSSTNENGCYLIELAMNFDKPTSSIVLGNSVLYPIMTASVTQGYVQPEFPDPGPNPDPDGDYGPIPGSGLYREGDTVTLKAPETMTSSSGALLRFLAWHEDGAAVSNEAEYSFICTGMRCLCAVYMPGSGGGGGTPKYRIEISSNIPEAVSCPQEYAEKGDTVTFYIADGYPIESLNAADKNGDTIEITRNGDGSYTFVMPIGEVTIQAIFTETNVSVPLVLPDGSVIFYDRGEEYGRYIIGTDGYPVRIDAAVDDGTAESVNWRYLVCEKNDLPEAKEWGPFGVSEGVIDPHIGAGLPNTNRMIEKYGVVDTYFWKDIEEKRKTTGFSWFMPSRDELYLIKENEDDILECGAGPFGSGSTWNWSSTEENHSYVYALVFSINYDETQGKNYPDNCRLIRRI